MHAVEELMNTSCLILLPDENLNQSTTINITSNITYPIPLTGLTHSGGSFRPNTVDRINPLRSVISTQYRLPHSPTQERQCGERVDCPYQWYQSVPMVPMVPVVPVVLIVPFLRMFPQWLPIVPMVPMVPRVLSVELINTQYPGTRYNLCQL